MVCDVEGIQDVPGAIGQAIKLNKQIAAQLGTSEVTIKVHRGKLTRRMRAE